MKQRISHGAELDIATPAEIAMLIAKANQTEDSDSYRRMKGTITNNAAGTGIDGNHAMKVSQQYDMRLERIVIAGPGAVNGLVGIYENQVSNTDLLEIIQLGSAGMYSDSFSNDVFLPAGTQLLIQCTGGVANAQWSWNLQIHEIKRKVVR